MNTEILSSLPATIKSILKLALQSRRCTVTPATDTSLPLIVMGNGPSLRHTIDSDMASLQKYPSMAVNFAANAPEFTRIKPRYYILCDPHFFTGGDANVDKLWLNLGNVDWDMTLFLPARESGKIRINNSHVNVETYNPVGVEGYKWLRAIAFSSGRGMPRPRNVLIPAIMAAIRLGYTEIYITGADHSWTRTLSVDDNNRVVSIQPHFYKDSNEEKERVTAVYTNVRLHDIINSFYVAFRAYHYIEEYAISHGIKIYNSTPGSFIDAFSRAPLPR